MGNNCNNGCILGVNSLSIKNSLPKLEPRTALYNVYSILFILNMNISLSLNNGRIICSIYINSYGESTYIYVYMYTCIVWQVLQLLDYNQHSCPNMPSIMVSPSFLHGTSFSSPWLGLVNTLLKNLAGFPYPAGMSLTKLSLDLNY
jgi:hypothetical protein